MDGVALASVISTASVSVASVGATVWATRYSSRSARAHQRLERLNDVYLEVLKAVHRQGLWVQALAADLVDRTFEGYRYLPHRSIPSRLEPGELAHVAALIGAFSSAPVKAAYESWADAVIQVEREREVIVWNAEQDGDPSVPLSDKDVERLNEMLAPAELQTRQALEVAISRDLTSR